MRTALRRASIAPLLLAALSATAPVARWCPLPWERVPAAVYLRCSLFSEVSPVRVGLTAGGPAASACAAAGAPSCAAAGASASACAHGRAGEGAASCPMAHPARARETAAPAGPAPVHSSRAYCLTDPGLASVWRPHIPAPVNSAVVVAVLVAETSIASPASARWQTRGLEPEARPPSAEPAARPPVRGPPVEPSFA